MLDKVIVDTEESAPPIGPYSQAVKCGNTLFLSGQIAMDPKTRRLVGKDAAQQTEQVLQNIEAILRYMGLTLGHVVRCSVFVVDLAEMRAINEVYAKHFAVDQPARTTVQVAALPGGARVEIEATAVLPPSPS